MNVGVCCDRAGATGCRITTSVLGGADTTGLDEVSAVEGTEDGMDDGVELVSAEVAEDPTVVEAGGVVTGPADPPFSVIEEVGGGEVVGVVGAEEAEVPSLPELGPDVTVTDPSADEDEDDSPDELDDGEVVADNG